MPTAKLNGAVLHYHVKGEGVPLVCIHPPLLTRAVFHYQTAQLSGAFQVVALDLRGHGLSSPVVSPFSYSLFTEDIKQLMDHLHIPRAIICGYSTGASVALEMLLTMPERCLGGIMLSGMSESSDVWLRSRIALAASLCKMKAKRALAWSICRANADSGTTFRNLFKEAMRGDVASWESYYRYSLDYVCTPRLPRLDLPVLGIFGEQDRAFRRYAKMLDEKLPRHKLVFVRRANHYLPTKAAGALGRVIRSWAEEQGVTLRRDRFERVLPSMPYATEETRDQAPHAP